MRTGDFVSSSSPSDERGQRETLGRFRISGQLVGGKYECLKFSSTTKDVWQSLHPSWKYAANRRHRSRLSRAPRGTSYAVETDRRRRHDLRLGSPLLLLPRHCALGGRTTPRYSLRLLHHRRNRKSGRLSRRPSMGV